ncbi:MAG: cobalamin biosynthesis protein CobW [Myxococcota bacterium]|jgi:cobalamin biosynthesis protein CobW
MKAIPALVISGYLGSGKTTLVRRLLEACQASGVRAAFISNEFGELGVDQALLGGIGETFVEMAGGCVCCALNDELYETLIELREKVNPDRIIIECSGVAVPHDVQIVFYQPPIRDWISEEAVVTVVNAEQVAEGRDLDGAFVEQLEGTDLVILNKLDLTPDADPEALKATLKAINPDAPVIRARHADVDLRLLLSPDEARDPKTSEVTHHHHHHHHETVVSEVVTIPDGLSEDALIAQLSALGALRVKGFVILSDGPAIVQGVGRRIETIPLDDLPSDDMMGRVVVIRRAEVG